MADIKSRNVSSIPRSPVTGGGLAARKRLAESAKVQTLRSVPGKRTLQRPVPVSPTSNTAVRGGKMTKAPFSSRFNNSHSPNLENRFKIQLRKYKMDLSEYQKTQKNMESCYEELMNLKDEMLKKTDVDPGEVPKPVLVTADRGGGDTTKRVSELEEELQTAQDNIKQMAEEKKKLEGSLFAVVKQLKVKEQDLLALDKEMEEELTNFEMHDGTINPFQDEHLKAFSEKVKRLQEERSRLVSVNMVTDLGPLPEPVDEDVAHLTETVKQLREDLESEKKNSMVLEENCSLLKQRLSEQEEMAAKQDPIDIKERLEHVNKVLEQRNLEKVIKVDFSADSKELCSQLAQVIRLYEDVVKENEVLVEKVKEVQSELSRLQRQMDIIAVKQNPESGFDYVKELETKCSDLQVQLSEMEEESEKMKSKLNLLYNKYKQYKNECVDARKRLQTFEKKNWIKKLISI